MGRVRKEKEIYFSNKIQKRSEFIKDWLKKDKYSQYNFKNLENIKN